ncbi:aldo/keto reductase [Paenibacillus chitinolyticus]|uniref:Aldo/keto reductase n=1 Tax=Paenibacillus chitinolyticus TaxID=79263 RepID=A0A410WPS4_9BACL|nr:aldo/keto reductase [Paenibacillus chitinolyticus]MCY9591007.1 aldo/keto reductase [Paenibacillus chitinolyticus]MCY9597192.1 aldo/keto reductase [Paenibacillus chitinolyticus]QAV16439.1 aldo/keto reductase [Paenibacillus chitinolyticus]
MNQTVEAANGVNIPRLGFGLYKIKSGEDFERAVEEAIRTGYRHFDTAKIYGNEGALGRVIPKSGIPREEFFITSKAWTTDLGYHTTRKAFEQTCRRLNVTYLDMYLIHFAGPHYVEAWKAMEELYDEGRIKVIGVANFEIRHLENLKKNSRISPLVNQVETHPQFPQRELHDYMVRHRILHEAWGPLGQGNEALLKHPELSAIAHRHRKSVAQVILRWHLERGIIVIPKSSNPQRIKENSEIFDFELNEEEMERIRRLDTGKRYSVSPTGYMVNPTYVKLMKLFICR